MENKFTPGPWRVKDNMIGEENNPNSIALAYKRDYSTFLDGTYKEDVEMLSNAKLMSAAPEMFEALQKAPILSMHNDAETFIEAYEHWRDNIKSPAIQKATLLYGTENYRSNKN